MLLKFVFSIAPFASKQANRNKTFKTEKSFNIKSCFLCYTVDVYCFIEMFACEMQTYSTPL